MKKVFWWSFKRFLIAVILYVPISLLAFGIIKNSYPKMHLPPWNEFSFIFVLVTIFVLILYAYTFVVIAEINAKKFGISFELMTHAIIDHKFLNYRDWPMWEEEKFKLWLNQREFEKTFIEPMQRIDKHNKKK